MGHEIGDIDISDIFHIESKLVGKMPKYLDDVMTQSFMDSMRGFKIDTDSISENRSKWCAGIIQERGRAWGDNIVIMKARDFAQIIKILKGNSDASPKDMPKV